MSLVIRENIELAPFTTLGVGGPARYFVRAEREEDVLAAFEYADSHALDVFVLGGGSNVIVADAGFDGLVIQIALKGIDIDRTGDREMTAKSSGRVTVTAAAGEEWDPFVADCVSRNLAGLECLSGIPGLVGGTPVQNVGAYGQDVSETIVSVRCFDREARRIIDISNEGCEFGYRKSIFNSTHRDRFVVLGVTYELWPDGEPTVAYKDLCDRFGDSKPTLSEVRDAVLNIRRSKSMVIDAGDPNSKSAGSFFKNPIVSSQKASMIADSFENVPIFPSDSGQVKIPAAWLIEKAGYFKGFSKGSVGLSVNHTLALINLGGATATEIVGLKDDIQKAVEEMFDISLQPEPVFIGF